MKKLLSVVLIFAMLSCCVLFSSCGEEQDYPVTVGGVTLEEEPESIVILDKNIADIISAIGYDGKTVGRSDSVDQKGYKVVPSFGSAQAPSVKEIAKSGAQVVFAGKNLNETDVEKLEKNGIAVIQLEEANTLKQLNDLYKKIGTILGGKLTGVKKAAKSYKDIKNTLSDVKRAAKRDNIISTIAYLYIDDGVLKTVELGTWGASMLDYTGFVNVFKNAESDVVNPADLSLANPDYIFVSGDDVEEYLNTSESLKTLDALETRTFIVDFDELNMQGYTSLDVMKQMTSDIASTQNSDDGGE